MARHSRGHAPAGCVTRRTTPQVILMPSPVRVSPTSSAKSFNAPSAKGWAEVRRMASPFGVCWQTVTGNAVCNWRAICAAYPSGQGAQSISTL